MVDNTVLARSSGRRHHRDLRRIARARHADARRRARHRAAGAPARPATGMARSHRAASVAAEAGHRWTAWPDGRGCAPATCGRRAMAIGDDDRHGTFFQMLPSSRKYALSSTYAQMNLTDAFVQAWFEPRGVEDAYRSTCTRPGQRRRISGTKAAAPPPAPAATSASRAAPPAAHSRLGTVLEGSGRRADQEILVGERVCRNHVGR